MLENETKKMEEKLELVKKMMDLEKNLFKKTFCNEKTTQLTCLNTHGVS